MPQEKTKKVAIKTLFGDEVFGYYGWSERHNAKTGRKSANNMKIFGEFLKGQYCNIFTFVRQRGYNCYPKNDLSSATSYMRERDNKSVRLTKVKNVFVID